MILAQFLDKPSSALLQHLNAEVMRTRQSHAWVSRDALERALHLLPRSLEKATSALLLSNLADIDGTYSSNYRVCRRLAASIDHLSQRLSNPEDALRDADVEYLRRRIAKTEVDLQCSQDRGQRSHAHTLATRLAHLKAAIDATRQDRGEKNVSPKKGVFISYRRVGGDQLAQSLKLALQNDYDVFLDVSSMPAGHFDESILRAIESRQNFVLVLSSRALDRCMTELDGDWLYREIAHAIRQQRTLVPVILPDFIFPPEEQLPEAIKDLPRCQAVQFSHEYFDAMMERLKALLN